MILVFGGTTEGRKAVEVLEEGARLTSTVRRQENRTSPCIMGNG